MSIALSFAAALSIAAALLLLTARRRRDRSQLLLGLAVFMQALPQVWFATHADVDNIGVLTWTWLNALPASGAGLLLAGAWLAWRATQGRTEGMAFGRPASPRNSPGRSFTHLGLRLVVVFLVAVLAGMLLMLAPSLLEAQPQLRAWALATLILMLVWAAWPLLDLFRLPAAPAEPALSAAE